ncbi:hypothetical protein CLCR_02517 [Cladophialophora carrionii]|uniref:Uncharacterized protein n=1 Tax=Cladophialophora carrionii TaxID=86049 RepID=A0A1C1CFY3_9EURO|nr:hypothetical protein CLCR_02517 [Cladophialophora carrionii]
MEFLLLLAFHAAFAFSAPFRRNPYNYIQPLANGDALFELGNKSYIANVVNPKAVATVTFSSAAGTDEGSLPLTVIKTEASLITQDVLQGVVSSYLQADDVFSEDFLEAVLISSSAPNAILDASAIAFLQSYNIGQVFVSGSFHASGMASMSTFQSAAPPAGPYLATIKSGQLELASVYLLYADSYRDFLYGTYNSDDGTDTYIAVPAYLARYWNPMIPVPSRIYSWEDSRPLAGERVAVKDLYDIKGLQTSGGSQAWAYVTPLADGTAPSVQKLIDLGAVIVGKYKLAQFASGADPWQWQDEHYPFNPRGDGWLTCSASSSGGGCSIAAYDWLDYAIGSDTGSSMRRPAAVSGVYG